MADLTIYGKEYNGVTSIVYNGIELERLVQHRVVTFEKPLTTKCRIRWKIGSASVYLGNSTDTAGAFPVYLIDSDKVPLDRLVEEGNKGLEHLKKVINYGLMNTRTLSATGVLNGYARIYYGKVSTQYTTYFVVPNATSIDDATMYLVYGTKSVTTASDTATDASFQFDNSLSSTKNAPKTSGAAYSTSGWYLLP